MVLRSHHSIYTIQRCNDFYYVIPNESFQFVITLFDVDCPDRMAYMEIHKFVPILRSGFNFSIVFSVHNLVANFEFYSDRTFQIKHSHNPKEVIYYSCKSPPTSKNHPKYCATSLVHQSSVVFFGMKCDDRLKSE